MSIVLLKTRVSEIAEKVYSHLHGEWTEKEYRDLVISKLKRKIDAGDIDLNDHLEEIIGTLVHSDVSTRAKIHINSLQGKLGDFLEADADQMVIPLGKGQRVKVSEATLRHHLAKQAAQTKNISSAVQEMQAYSDIFIDSELGQLLTENPGWTTRDGMRFLKYWQIT